MATLQQLIDLSKQDGGKFYVIDTDGEIRLVILPVEEYQKLMGQKVKTKVEQLTQDVERINREILKAQLSEYDPVTPVNTPHLEERDDHNPRYKGGKFSHNFVDLREEVIDPSFDFEGPKMDIDEI
jgi:hypothetical protein